MLRDHYFEELAGEERYPFELLRRAIADGAAECTLPVADDASVRRIWDAVVMDHPELVRYPGLKCYAQVSGRGTVIPLEYLDADEALYARRLEGMVRAVEARLTPASSDYAVCKAIYDVIAGCVTYQSAVLEKYGVPYQILSNDSEPAADKLNLKAMTPDNVTPASGCDYYLCPEPAASAKIAATAGK